MSRGHDPWGDPEGESNAQDGSPTSVIVPYDPRPRSSSEERTPLLPGRRPLRRILSPNGVKFVACALLMLAGVIYLMVEFPYLQSLRRDWQKEVEHHEVLREVWHLEQQQHTVLEDEWKLEVESHEQDVMRRIREENERRERVRKEWEQEGQERDKEVAKRTREEEERQERVRSEWVKEVQEYEREVVRRTLEEEKRQDRTRKEWVREEERHRHEWEEMERREDGRREHERQKWRREMEDHDQIEEEHRKREEEERQKLNMFWGQVEAHTCTTYGAREYTAQLKNLPATWEHRVEACKVTPLEVHGISYLPQSCEDKGPGVVIGRWTVNQHEPACAPFWDWYKDKGCTSPGSGKRRIEHYLDHLPEGGNWREFCATTPARFHGMEFTGAQECFQYNSGTYGHWEIDATDCQ